MAINHVWKNGLLIDIKYNKCSIKLHLFPYLSILLRYFIYIQVFISHFPFKLWMFYSNSASLKLSMSEWINITSPIYINITKSVFIQLIIDGIKYDFLPISFQNVETLNIYVVICASSDVNRTNCD